MPRHALEHRARHGHARRHQTRRLRTAGIVTALTLAASGLVAGSAADAAGNTSATTYTLWGDRTPSGSVDSDTQSVELGTAFTATQDGSVLGLRFYKTPENTGTHVGHLWASNGKLLATITFAHETSRGWQTATLSTPVKIKAGQRYVASYLAPHGRYFQAENFTGASTTPLLAVERGRSGVYHYGKRGGFPTSQWHSSQYRADVVFAPSGPVPASTTGTATPTKSPGTSPTPTTTAPRPTPTATRPTTTAPRPTASSGATASPRPTTSASPTTTPTTPSSPPATGSPSSTLPSTPGATTLSLPRVPWWGGPAYYAKFSKAAAAGWTDPSFFPISVFLGKPEHASQLKAIGINTYMAAEHDGSSMSSITRTGMDVIAQQHEWTQAEVGNDSRVVGWFLSDECDMGLGGCDGDQYSWLAQQKAYADKVRAYDDGRLVQANFGNGVLGTYWSPDTMDSQLGLVDVSSVDKYAYTSPDVDGLFKSTPTWPKAKNPASASAYGWLQDRMETYSSAAAPKPNWVFVETARPFLTDNGARTITGNQIEGAVWNGIIHGSAGIAYFQHNNDPSCGVYSLLQCGAALTNKVAAIDAQVARLAPVINTQSYQWTFGAGLDTSLKVYGGYAYVFAMTDGSTGQKTFTLPAGVHGTSVEVVDEGRTLAASGGTFSDSFAAEYTHHIYRVALDS
jgi:hypothetical protein